MSRKIKNSRKENDTDYTKVLVLITTIIQLTSAIINLIDKLVK